MLGEVPNHHVPAGTGDAGPTDVVRRELGRQSLVHALYLLEIREHFRVPRGVGTAARNLVGPVLAVLPCGSEELSFLGQRVPDGVL